MQTIYLTRDEWHDRQRKLFVGERPVDDCGEWSQEINPENSCRITFAMVSESFVVALLERDLQPGECVERCVVPESMVVATEAGA